MTTSDSSPGSVAGVVGTGLGGPGARLGRAALRDYFVGWGRRRPRYCDVEPEAVSVLGSPQSPPGTLLGKRESSACKGIPESE